MEVRNLKTVMENFIQEPSGHCWQAIEQQLAVVMPATVAAESAMSTSKGGILSKMAAAPLKTITIITSAVAVVTTSTILILSSYKDNQTPDNQSLVNTSPLHETILEVISESNETTVVVEEKALKTNSQRESILANTPPSVNSQPETNILPTTSTPSQFNSPTQSTTSILQPTPVTKPDPPTQPQSPTTTPSTTKIDAQPTGIEPITPFKETVKIVIPNVFTPNGDGYNDTFEIVGIEHCTDTRLVVRTSNGKIIYQTTNYQNNWDGGDLPDGIYYYSFSYKINNIPDNMSGTVLIKRGLF